MERIFKAKTRALYYIAVLFFLSGCGNGIAEGKISVSDNEGKTTAISDISDETEENQTNTNEKEKKKPCRMKVKTPSGHELCLELAITPAEREKGLMFRKELAEGQGMMFIFDDDKIKSFWMKNTLISLDIVYLDENYTAVRIFDNVPNSYIGAPENEIPSVSYWGRNVLELPAGNAEKYGLRFGARLTDIRLINENSAEK